ncbi:MAG: sulfite exporter TauE/SafE family protein [Leptospiraceae bacterium]|nr:sulfite exporter TauE/SafE family protein [Leptospiraceae bacterium]MCP5497853.1 sulfite exporter TauE/SafE family protein [Leptospiraceae bacterium]
MEIKIILLFFGSIIAFWVSSICGGGASLVLIPSLTQLVSLSSVPVALTIGTFASSASKIIVFKQNINWKVFYWFVPFAIPTVWLGAYLIKYTNPIYLEFFIAIFLISNVFSLFKPKEKLFDQQKPYPNYVLSIIGFLAGFVSGITGAIGLIFNKFYLRYGLSKEEIVATRAANEIFLHLIKLILYFSLGLATKDSVYFGITIAIAATISAITVKKLLPYVSENMFRRIGYSAMVISGIFLLVNASIQIIRQDSMALTSEVFSDSYETRLSWKESQLSLEFSYDDGFEVEQKITFEELPLTLRVKYNELVTNSQKAMFEKVYSFGKTSYEIYLIQNGKIHMFEDIP